ncbi:hypothetical protein ACDL92_01530 [Ihubacter sp. mB4P-1]|uniref:hypothetical protein n=1 Tax=Ihubacter sp. mB4P-1 TaxID=3242370 RepID=UPI00137A4FC8
MISCDAKNGCGTVSLNNPNFMTMASNRPAQTLSYSQMTNCTSHQQEAAQAPTFQSMTGSGQLAWMGGPSENSDQPTLTGQAAATTPMPGATATAQNNMEMIPGQPDPPMAATRGGSTIVPEGVLPESPKIKVPTNPLLPPGYQEFIDYENLQYLNGFLRTQIGRYMRIEQLIGSSTIEDRYGFLLGVGINYILLQELGTGNVLTLDYYSIKSLYIFYSQPALPENPALQYSR